MKLEIEIDYLNQTLFKMGDTVAENLIESINYYLGKIDSVNINDDLVDKYERLIEEICLTILLKERPYAKDLKIVTGILKLVADVERIGDHAEDIYSFAKKLKNVDVAHYNEIEKLANFVINMFKNSIKSYIDMDINMANKIIADDDYVDKTYVDIINLLINTDNNSNVLPFAIYTTLVVKYLERIADHCVNLAEWVIYISNGYHKDKKIC